MSKNRVGLKAHLPLVSAQGNGGYVAFVIYQKRGGIKLIKRMVSIILVLCMMLAPVINVDALENSNGNTEKTKDAQKTDINDELKQDVKNVSRESSQSVDVAEPVALADDVPTSGACGPNATWRLEEDTLIISGTGEMSYDDDPPWESLRRYIQYVKISYGITSIGDGAFYEFHINTITIPNSVTDIGDSAFFFSELTNIVIPNSVTHIGVAAFAHCYELTSVNISNSVVSIGEEVFSYCSSLTSITIPDSVVSIGDYAFDHCRSLAKITIPDSVTNIGSDAFAGCYSLVDITLPNNMTSIKDGAFAGCYSLASIVIPNSVTSIGDYAFTSCYNLADVYYAGDKNSWQNIIIGKDSDLFANVTVHFYSTTLEYDPLKYKVYTNKDASPINGYEGFHCSLEACVYGGYSGSYNYKPRLAHMLIAMCNSVYDETNMKATFNSFGFKDSDLITDYNMWDGIWIGYGMAKKNLGNGKKLVLIVARGTEDVIEWISNFDTRINVITGQHLGFSLAANGLYDKMTGFLGTTDFSNTQFVITGFSRGAAVANILAGRLVDEGVLQRDIYAYTFACPDVGLFSNEKVNSYECIFNIADAEDIVSWVPQTIFGNIWNKFGRSYWYSDIWNDYENLEMCTGAHNQAAYLKYLRSERYEDEYKSRSAARSILNDAEIWRVINKLFSSTKKTILGVVGIHCPVDVEISDAKGQLVGKIVNNVTECINSDKIHISIIDGQKDIYLLDNDAYTFKITAISDGTMEYIVQNIRASDQSVVDSKIYSNINLTEGKQMTSSVQSRGSSLDDTSVQTSEVQLFVLDDNGNAKAEVIADGNGTEIPVVDKIENPNNPDPGNTDTNTPGNNPSNSGTNQPKPGNSGNQTKVEKIDISGLSHKIAIGKKITLTASVSPSNATNKSITWSSSNTKYATVNNKGVVNIKKAGAGKTVTITATANDGSGKKATYKIKCMKGIVKKVAISGKKTQNLRAGKSINLKTKVTASKGANKTLQWTSSNKKYATVTNKGKVVAKKAGKGKTVKITAMATDGSGKKVSVKIKIK